MLYNSWGLGKIMDDDYDDYFTISEAAMYLGVSNATLRIWEKKGKITCIRCPTNNFRLYRVCDLQEFLMARNCGNQTAPIRNFLNIKTRDPRLKKLNAIRASLNKSIADLKTINLTLLDILLKPFVSRSKLNKIFKKTADLETKLNKILHI